MNKVYRSARAIARRLKNKYIDEYTPCYICGHMCSVILEGHHLYPLSETDTAENTLVLICPNCHALIHKYYQLFWTKRKFSKKQLRERDVLWEYIYVVLSSDVQERLLMVINRSITKEKMP